MKPSIRNPKQLGKIHTPFAQHLQIATLALLLIACAQRAPAPLALPSLAEEIQVDARTDEGAWEQAWMLEGLISPWPGEEEDKTTFKAFASPGHFNFSFDVWDNSLTTVPFQNETSVEKEDRVELFFSNDTSLTTYYCIEIDPNGNTLDYSASFYRDFDKTWDFSSKELATRTTDKGYLVEGKISLNELSELGISFPFYVGIFRADFRPAVENAVTWFSWQRPKSKTPDFHIPSAFGEIVRIE